ncbi:hypothetical protein [Caldimonas brevitalea]|uniref:Uncharacterized protein n=1 Tax=Caldimonas brevitalea TaxID=413882 RepID=A0A0G3BHE7_9BURK|nr:hypothetical protein [Caldimonas brevitalea]AKJ28854.1 hypothetical protein AAW51_2163 [Caldimonas brevitalea]
MIPIPWTSPRFWLAIGLAAALAVSHGWAYHRGGASVQAKWDRAELERERELSEARSEQQRLAARAAARFEASREAIRQQLATTQEALQDALDQPVPVCPRTVGDAVVPGALGVRLNAIDEAGATGAAAGELAR